jgi:RimJ/RimL family protein N-acetyltransferase
VTNGEVRWSVTGAAAYGRQVLTGSRVRLRGLRDDDLPTLVRWWQDPELGALQMTSVVPASEAAGRELFARWSANQDTDVGFSVETLPTTGEPAVLVGHLGLFDVRPKARSATFAIGLGAGHLGRGYGTDATRLAVSYGFREMNLHRIQLTTLAFNERASAAYRKAGFREEGRRRDAVFHDGAYHDEILMSVLATDAPLSTGER